MGRSRSGRGWHRAALGGIRLHGDSAALPRLPRRRESARALSSLLLSSSSPLSSYPAAMGPPSLLSSALKAGVVSVVQLAGQLDSVGMPDASSAHNALVPESSEEEEELSEEEDRFQTDRECLLHQLAAAAPPPPMLAVRWHAMLLRRGCCWVLADHGERFQAEMRDVIGSRLEQVWDARPR
eukprot:COSAG01_NODE_475_length_16519_cov_168.890621_5_plen_182_part_00